MLGERVLRQERGTAAPRDQPVILDRLLRLAHTLLGVSQYRIVGPQRGAKNPQRARRKRITSLSPVEHRDARNPRRQECFAFVVKRPAIVFVVTGHDDRETPQIGCGLFCVAQRRDITPRPHPADITGKHEEIRRPGKGTDIRSESERPGAGPAGPSFLFTNLGVNVAEIENCRHRRQRQLRPFNQRVINSSVVFPNASAHAFSPPRWSAVGETDSACGSKKCCR